MLADDGVILISIPGGPDPLGGPGHPQVPQGTALIWQDIAQSLFCPPMLASGGVIVEILSSGIRTPEVATELTLRDRSSAATTSQLLHQCFLSLFHPALRLGQARRPRILR